MLCIRKTNCHQLRRDNDFFLLEVPPKPNLTKTESAFCYSGPRAWNELPFALRARSEYESFKSILKTHFFKLAFSDLINPDELFFM